MRKKANITKRILSSILAVTLFASLSGFTTYALEDGETVIKIENEGDFVLLAEQCRTENFSTGKLFRLENDLDLSEYTNLFLPVMDGTFEGNGHQIIGVTLGEEMSDYGLFRYVGENGAIRNLTVEAEVLGKEEQEHIGIIAGSNAGQIQNCTSRGSVNGDVSVGGIAGKNEKNGTISRSHNEAQIDAVNAVGGITGYNEGTISDCTNTGAINTNQRVKKDVDGEGTLTISIPNAVAGFAKDERANQSGGIAGYSSGTISYCTNEGTVGYEHLGYETGGIVGRQSGSISYSENHGTIYGRKDVGGIVGYFEPYEMASYDRDYSKELEDQLDELGNMVDNLQAAGDTLGDHLSDHVDVLSDQLKALKNSVRGYLNHYEDMAEDSEDAIRDRVEDLRHTINGMQYDFGLEKMENHRKQIAEDIRQIQEILAQLQALANAVGGDAKEQIQGIIAQYSGQLEELKQALEGLKDYIANQPDRDKAVEGEETQPPKSPDENGGNKEETAIDGSGENKDQTEDTSEDDTESTGNETGNNEDNEESSGVDVGNNEESSGVGAENNGEASENGSGSDEEAAKSGLESDKEPSENSTVGNEDSTRDGLENSESTTGNESEGSGESTRNSTENDDSAANSVDIKNIRYASTASNAQMESISFTTVAKTEDSTNEVLVQVNAALQKLQALNADIQVQLKGIVTSLEGIPGEALRLHSDFQTLGNRIHKIFSTLDDELDDWSDDLGNMKNDLQGQGDRISDQIEITTDTLDADWDVVSDCIDRIKNQFENIRATISDSFDELKNRIEDRTIYVDISDLATGDPGEGKLVYCNNSGEIYADSQGGGITGSIRKEGREEITGWLFDSKSEDEDEEDSKDSITKHVLAAIFWCVNTGGVSVENDYAGGIVGWASYGAIVSSENYGDVWSKDGSYAGGIAGKSEHGIRDCYVLSGVSGTAYVGGAAGEGEDISGSYICSYMDMEDYVKSNGAIAGNAKGTVERNYFVDNGYGAVDGVTRSSEAEAVSYEAMLELKEMPRNFTEFTIRFMDEEQIVWQDTFSYGEEFPEEAYPNLPDAGDGYVYWEAKELSPIHRNVTVHAIRRAFVPSLAANGELEKPEVLLGGEFYPDSAFVIQEASKEEQEKITTFLEEQNLQSIYYVKKVYSYQISQEEPLRDQVSLRVLNDSYLADSLMVLSEDLGVSSEAQKAQVIGSYLASRMTVSENGYILVLDKVERWMLVAGLIGSVLVILLIIIFISRRQSKRKIAVEDQKEDEKKDENEEK